MLLHKAPHSLQPGVEGLGAKGVAKQGRCLEDDERVTHVDALLALGEHELKELHLDGPQNTRRAIEEGLPVAGLPLSPIGSADLGNFLAPPGKSFEIHGQNFRGSAEGEIALTPQALALIQKHKLLDKGVPLAERAVAGGRWSEACFVDRQLWGGGALSRNIWRTPRAKNSKSESYKGPILKYSRRKWRETFFNSYAAVIQTTPKKKNLNQAGLSVVHPSPMPRQER